ncbi:MAG: aspartyl protease family protein [Imperialibacter sp.]|uniref:aspartyl protease family protein n=1 Tax=Imperialibacter sp. TaxID=2038411 RepID=UPI0032F074D3
MKNAFFRLPLIVGLAFILLGASSAYAVSVPFELFGDHIFIKIKVNNSRDLHFIFDSADALTVLNESVAKEIGLTMDHKSIKQSAGGSTSGFLVKHQMVEIGNFEIKNLEVYATDLSHLEISIGRKIDGIIGYDVLSNYVVTIDYGKMKFSVIDPSSYAYSGAGLAFDLKMNTYVPYVSGTAVLANGESLTGDFFLDTGAKAAIDFNGPFVNSNKLVSKMPRNYSYLVSGISKEETTHYRGRIKEFQFGTYSFKEVPVGLSQATSGLQSNAKVAGIIGNEILMQFNITFDYSRKKIYLEPNARYGESIADDASGFDLQYSSDMSKLLIHRVHDGSPAGAAGIKVDDELVKIDGKTVKDMSLPDIRKKLSMSGTEVSLTVKSGGEEKSVTLKLMEII